MKLVCPECKNEVDLSAYPAVAPGHVVECNHCGITLMIGQGEDNFTAEVVDEGK